MIKFIRGFITIFCFIFFGISALIFDYFVFPLQKSKYEQYEILRKSWAFFIQLLIKLHIIRLNVTNIDKIKNIKNSIIVSTHPSFIDIVVLISIIPYSTCFVANRLAQNFFLKGIVKLLFLVETKSIDELTEATCKKLNDGLNVIIFPMGIRHRKNETPRIRRGTALIAQKSHKNIVMLNLETDYDFLQINQPIYDAGDKSVLYTLEYLGQINTNDYLDKYPDAVTFNTKITKQIAKNLYKDKI